MMSDGQGKVEWYDLIEKIKTDKNKYHESIDLFGEYMDVQIAGDTLANLKRIVNNAVNIMAKPLTEKEHKKYTKFMFDVGVNWYCQKWENRNTVKKFPIEWERCNSFKPLELYSSIFNNKSKISESDSENLDYRREKEKHRINQQDSYRYERTETWYAIDSQWTYDWKMFVNNQRNALAMGAKKSDIEGVGILDPGPISNNNLFEETGELKQNLEKGKHYRLVNENVWKSLYDIYSGGQWNSP